MKLETLRVFHRTKHSSEPSDGRSSGQMGLDSPGVFSPHLFVIDTCQRTVCIFNSRLETHFESYCASGQSGEILRGEKAYHFLLRWAAGLESVVVGETDIFGQIKEAWRRQNLAQLQLGGSAPSLADLASWMQKLFEDTKEIRTQYLQNIGGTSYGTLVRKWLRKHRLEGPVLIVGAGQLARSIAPSLLELELWLLNRDPVALDGFYQQLASQSSEGHPKKVERARSDSWAWQNASAIVVCIPLDSIQDVNRVQWFLNGNDPKAPDPTETKKTVGLGDSRDRAILHLGLRGKDRGAWSQVEHFFCLDDLFALQESLGSARTLQISQAEKACAERARLRSLGGSLSVSHGWEDLACFA